MSWQQYVDDQLMGTGKLNAAAIALIGDGGIIATTPDFLRAGEGAAIATLYKNPSQAFAQGITVGGVQYMATKADDRSIYGKKGATGVVLVRTMSAILIGYYDEKQAHEYSQLVVEKLADYLTDNHY